MPPGPDEWQIEPVAFAEVQLTDDFWAPRMEINRTVTIPHLARQNEETGRQCRSGCIRHGIQKCDGPKQQFLWQCQQRLHTQENTVSNSQRSVA